MATREVGDVGGVGGYSFPNTGVGKESSLTYLARVAGGAALTTIAMTAAAPRASARLVKLATRRGINIPSKMQKVGEKVAIGVVTATMTEAAKLRQQTRADLSNRTLSDMNVLHENKERLRRIWSEHASQLPAGYVQEQLLLEEYAKLPDGPEKTRLINEVQQVREYYEEAELAIKEEVETVISGIEDFEKGMEGVIAKGTAPLEQGLPKLERAAVAALMGVIANVAVNEFAAVVPHILILKNLLPPAVVTSLLADVANKLATERVKKMEIWKDSANPGSDDLSADMINEIDQESQAIMRRMQFLTFTQEVGPFKQLTAANGEPLIENQSFFDGLVNALRQNGYVTALLGLFAGKVQSSPGAIKMAEVLTKESSTLVANAEDVDTAFSRLTVPLESLENKIQGIRANSAKMYDQFYKEARQAPALKNRANPIAT